MEVAILFGLVIVLLLIGVPIAVSLGLSSILFLLVLSDTSLASIAQSFFQAMAGHYTLLAIPFFYPCIVLHVDWRRCTKNYQIFHCHSRTFPWWTGDCRGICLYVVRGPVWFVARNSCRHRYDRHRRNEASWIFQGIRRGRHRKRRHIGHLDPTLNCDGRLCIRH